MKNLSSKGRIVWVATAIFVIAVAASGAVAVGLYASRLANTPGNTGPATQKMTMSEAVQSFKNYLGSQDSNIALHEVEEYQYNFYASYYEKNSGTFAFQMLIWKQGSSYMMGMMGYTGATKVAVPEMGPNMMWNTKYHVAGGMMNGGMMGNAWQSTSTPMTVTASEARTLAQQYLTDNFSGKSAGDADTYYGYYNIDVLIDGSTWGMLSVNGYTGQVWYHAWHGTFVQTITME